MGHPVQYIPFWRSCRGSPIIAKGHIFIQILPPYPTDFVCIEFNDVFSFLIVRTTYSLKWTYAKREHFTFFFFLIYNLLYSTFCLMTNQLFIYWSILMILFDGRISWKCLESIFQSIHDNSKPETTTAIFFLTWKLEKYYKRFFLGKKFNKVAWNKNLPISIIPVYKVSQIINYLGHLIYWDNRNW